MLQFQKPIPKIIPYSVAVEKITGLMWNLSIVLTGFPAAWLVTGEVRTEDPAVSFAAVAEWV